jgi:hypothetical protein
MKQILFHCILLLVFLCSGTILHAQTAVEQDVFFSTANQGWYKSGIPSYAKKDYLLDGDARTFQSFSIGSSSTLSLEGKFGVDFDLFYDVLSMPDGKVGVDFPIKVKFEYPTDRTYGCGEELPIATSYTVKPGYRITSEPPQFKMAVGLKAKAGAWAGVDSYFGGGTIMNIGNGSFADANSSNFEGKMKGGERPVLGFDTQNGIYTPFQQNLPYTIPPDVTEATSLSGTIRHPFTTNPADHISGTSISEVGGQTCLDLYFDPVQFVGDYFGIPLSGEASISGLGSAGYTLFEAPFSLSSGITHSLEFNPKVNIKMQLDRTYNYRVRDQYNNIVQFGTGNEVTLEAGHVLLVTVPDDNAPITVTPTYLLDNDFTTHIRFDAGIDLHMEVGSAYAQTTSIEICEPTGILDAIGVDDCYTIGPWGHSVGPLWSETFNLYDFGYDFYPPTTRELAGFQNFTGSSFTLRPDNTAPVLTTKDITVYIPDAGGPVGIIPQDVVQSASDAHGGTLRYLEVTPNSFTCDDLGSNPVEVTIDDSRCNPVTRPANVTVVDRTKPTLACKPVTVYLDDIGETSIVTDDVFQSGWDNCGQVNHVSVLPNEFECSHLGPNLVTFLANDGHGNTNTCTATVTVVDNKPPVLVCQPKTVYLDDQGEGSIIVEDVLQSFYDNCGTVNITGLSRYDFDCSDIGTHTVTVFTNDGHGNNMTCNATVTVLDRIIPSVECKFKVETFLNAAGQASITTADLFLNGADNCGTVNQQSVAPSTFTCSNLGPTLVVLTVNDGHGNTNTCTTNVSVMDVIRPTMICRNVTLNLNSSGQASLTVAQVNNGSFDNCTLADMNLNRTSFDCSNLGVNTVTLTGRDQNFNENQCTATITVRDQIAPVARCKNITANLGANGSLTLTPSMVDNISTDNCAFSMTVSPNTFNCANAGPNTVTLRATDASNNSSSCTAVVTVKDATAPTALCKNATVFLNDVGQGVLQVSDVNNGSSDACGIATVTLNKTQFNCSELQGSPWNVVLTVKDVHNNTSTCLSSVTIRDISAPTAICENTTVQLGPGGQVTVYGAQIADGSYDNCAVWSYTPVAKVYTTANLGNNNLNITVRDWSGNAASCVAVVTVIPSGGNLGGGGDREEQPDPAEEMAASAEVKIYPNPTSGETAVQFELSEEQDCQIRVFDTSGRLVFDRQGRGLKGENIIPITLQGLSNGVYMLEFRAGKMKTTRQLVVQE